MHSRRKEMMPRSSSTSLVVVHLLDFAITKALRHVAPTFHHCTSAGPEMHRGSQAHGDVAVVIS
jgi:hypothetical protein